MEKVNLKIFATLSFIFITLALIFIYQNSPAKGYELSLYSSLPPATWVLLISAIVMGTWIIVSEAFSEKKSNLWYLGFFILILSNFIILSLHFFRGYYFLTISDPIGHAGFAASIISSGNISNNYYPVTHILAAETTEISSIELLTLMKYLPIIFTILSMVFIYLLASEITENRSHALLAAATGSTLLFSYYHISAYPQALSLLTFPLGFYLYFKASNTQGTALRILFIIFLILFPFFHPAIEIVFVSCLVGGEIARYFFRKYVSNVHSTDRISTNPALISVIIFFAWFMAFSVFGTMTRKFTNWFENNAAEIPRFNELDSISKLEPLDQILLAIKMYGNQFIYLILSIIAIFIIVRCVLNRRAESKNLFILSVFLVTAGFTYVIIFMGAGLTTIGRLAGANTILWITPVLAGFSLFKIFNRPAVPKSIAISMVTLVVVVASIQGIFTIYRSPWIYQINTQITQMDMKGWEWASSYETQGSKFGYLGWPTGYNPVKIPPHFGYRENYSFGESLRQNMTFILTKKFKLATENPTLRRSTILPSGLSAQGFESADIERLEQDKSVDRVYANGDFELLHVRYSGNR